MMLLFGALVFATTTTFVQENWAAMAFAVLVGLLLTIQSKPVTPWILVIPSWGLLQLLAGTTIYPQTTVYAVVYWMSMAAVFLLARQQNLDWQRFLNWFVGFAAVEAMLCMAQLYTSQGKVLWLFQSEFDYVYGTFQSYNGFAQFMEMALAVALVGALRYPKQAIWYALASGMIYASVIASTSRAGSILVTLELFAVPLLWLLSRPRSEPVGGEFRRVMMVLGVVTVLAAGWTFAAGWDRLFQRLQNVDPMSGRKEFLLSAMDMTQAKPLLGHGLGTFSYGYPGYARIDLPTFVIHVHNDWAEFAADGGILFAVFLLLPMVWATRRILHEPWAVGSVVLAIHAVVDFPLLRTGVAAWYFAILGIVTAPVTVRIPAVFGWVNRAAGLAGALAAGWFCIAEIYSLQDTPETLAQAIRMVPGDAAYWLRHSQLTGDKVSLNRALQLNPLEAQILTEAGLRAEVEGKLDLALDLLQRSAEIDRTWLPRWSLANFHFRRGNEAEFWKWAKAAATTGSSRDFTALFRLADAMDPDRETAAAKLLPDRPQVLREWIAYVLKNSKEKDVDGLRSVPRRLVELGVASPDRNYVVAAVERFLAAKQPVPAGELWKGMVQKGWLPSTIGQSFAANPLNEGFDWRMSPAEGVVVSPHLGTWTVSFSGKQPEFWAALHRIAEVEPARRYRLRVEYETEGVRSVASGVRWRVLDEMNGQELVRSAPLAADGRTETFIEFEAPNPLVRIQLFCEREQGYGRVNGSIRLSAAELIRVT